MKSSGCRTLRRWVCAAVASAALAACGGGSGNGAPAPTLGGTAAVGDPIAGGTVTVSCASGPTLQTTTSATGAWTVSLPDQTLPCAVQVSGGTAGGAANGSVYHSIALAMGTVNVTPLTDLVVARLLGAAPQTWFSAPTFTSVGTDSLRNALGAVSTALGLSGTLGERDPLTSKFEARSGDLIDDILEAYRAALAKLAAGHADLLAAAVNGNFSGYTAFQSAFQTAYASLGGSAGGSSSCSTGTAMTYAQGSAGSPFADKQTVCFVASSSSLAFNSTTLTNPVRNTDVLAPYAAYKFSDGSLSYEVIFENDSLYEINLMSGSSFLGQFSPASSGSGSSASGSLTVNVSVSGIASSSINVGNVPVPASEAEFCGGIANDSTFSSIGASGGGTLTIDSCSFSGKTGTISATLAITSPVAMTVPYTVTYVYN